MRCFCKQAYLQAWVRVPCANAVPAGKAMAMTLHSPALGLSWGISAHEVRNRFPGLPPAEEGDALVWPLELIVSRLLSEGAFCPTAFMTLNDTATFMCAVPDDQLVAVDVDFGYSFESTGHDPDTLSDLAMTAVSRTELHDLLQELAARYGAPQLFSDAPSRRGKWMGVANALYVCPDGTSVGLRLGFDHAGIVGRLRYLCPTTEVSGF